MLNTLVKNVKPSKIFPLSKQDAKNRISWTKLHEKKQFLVYTFYMSLTEGLEVVSVMEIVEQNNKDANMNNVLSWYCTH